MTRRVWEKTRETPDQSIGCRQETGPGSFGMNADLGVTFFPLFPITTMRDRSAISPQSLHEGISPSDKTASLGRFAFKSTAIRNDRRLLFRFQKLSETHRQTPHGK